MADFIYLYKFQLTDAQLAYVAEYSHSGAFTFYARLDHTSTIRPTDAHITAGIDVFFRFYDSSMGNELEIDCSAADVYNFDNPYAKACEYMEVAQDFSFEEELGKPAGGDLLNWISGLSPYDTSGTRFLNVVLSGTMFDDEAEMWDTDDTYAALSLYQEIERKYAAGFLMQYSGVVQE